MEHLHVNIWILEIGMVMNVISECECADCVKYGTFACEYMDS
jgi:hypothetical protein